MGLFDKLFPEQPKEIDKVTPLNELHEDLEAIKIPAAIYCSAAVIISIFLSGFFYQYIMTIFNNQPIFILSSFRYGITKTWFLTLILIILFVIGGFRVYRAFKKNYRKNYKDNYLTSNRATFGNAHFQEEDELCENFDFFDTIEETDGHIFGLHDDKVVCFNYPNGMNMNDLYCGAPGSGKSSSTIKNKIYQSVRRGDSIIITDTKGDIYKETGAVVKSLGYTVRVLNLKPTEFRNSDAFNLFASLHPDDEDLDTKADVIANIIIKNTSNGKDDYDYWGQNEFNLFKCIIMFLATNPSHIKLGHNNLPYILTFLTENNTPQKMKAIFTTIPKESPIRICYDIFAGAEERNQGQIINGAAIRLTKLTNPSLRNVLSNNEIDLTLPMKKKCAYYIIISDTDDAYKFISALFFSLMFYEQCNYSDALSVEQKKKQLPVYYLLDEYRATGGIQTLPIKIATVRSRKIGLTIILQDIGQFSSIHEEGDIRTILNACTVKGLLSTNDIDTATYFSQLLGNSTAITEGERMMESTADVMHAHFELQKVAAETNRPLRYPEELMNGVLPRDEVVYIISGMPPVKLKKCFAEKMGEALHPLEKLRDKKDEAGLPLYGYKYPNKRRPKWRKALEGANKKTEKTEAAESKETRTEPEITQPAPAPEPQKNKQKVFTKSNAGKTQNTKKTTPAPSNDTVFTGATFDAVVSSQPADKPKSKYRKVEMLKENTKKEEAPKEEKVNNTVKEDQINCPADSLYKEPERQENQTEENEIPPLPPIESVMASLNITEQLSEPKVINQKQEPPQEKTTATFTGSVITFSESD